MVIFVYQIKTKNTMNKNLFKIALVITSSLFFVGIAFLFLNGVFSDILDEATEMSMFIISLFSAVSILVYGLSSTNE